MKGKEFVCLILLLAICRQTSSNPHCLAESNNAELLPDASNSRVKRDLDQENLERINAERKVLELYIVCDKLCYETVAEKYDDPAKYFYDVVLIADMKLQNISSQLVLVGLELWNIHNKIVIDTDLLTILRRMEYFRTGNQVRKIWSDFTVLFTGFPPSSGGIAFFNWGHGCHNMGSAGVISTNHGSVIGSAGVLVHEILHGMGPDHDEEGCCDYKNGRGCVMSPIINNFNLQHSYYSSCTIDDLLRWLYSKYNRSTCVFDEPKKAFVPEGLSDSCGNGVVEDGEQCDCGQGCLFGCCECCENCQLKDGAECAKGDCCNVTTCKFLGNDTVCKEANHASCDQDHVCSGQSPDCLISYRIGGEECVDELGDTGYCRQGRCLTRDEQCKHILNTNPNKVYGEAPERCYNRSIEFRADKDFNCGRIYPNSYRKCSAESQNHYKCGLLQCTGPDRIQGREASDAAILQRFIWPTELDTGEYCLTSMELPWEVFSKTYGLVPLMVKDGTPCMENGACYHGDCLNKSSVFELLNQEDFQPEEPRGYCGDGIVNSEIGEECDCGPLQCPCCDINGCKFKRYGTTCSGEQCRFCDGQSVTCNEEHTDFRFCKNEEGRCHKGECITLNTLNDTCKKILGPTGEASPQIYYECNLQPEDQMWIPQFQWRCNAGGYLFTKPIGPYYNDWKIWKYEKATDNDGYCGILSCNDNGDHYGRSVEAKLQALGLPTNLNSERFNFEEATKFGSSNFADRMYYFTLENQTFIEEGEVYDKFMPILVPDGLPCTVGESRKPGYCEKRLAVDNITWYWYSTCVEL